MISRLSVQNFKSFRKLDIPLSQRNIIIGPNGVGKSNFIGIFKFVKEIYEQNLQKYVISNGGADRILHMGRKNSNKIDISLYFQKDADTPKSRFLVSLAEAQDKLFIENVSTSTSANGEKGEDDFQNHGTHMLETDFKKRMNGQAAFINEYIQTFDVYHFHDTGKTSPLKLHAYINDNSMLRSDGANLPAILYLIKEKYPDYFDDIVAVVNTVFPPLKTFRLSPNEFNNDIISLQWVHREAEDYFFDVNQLSDGTLRFIALTTLLMQPNPPRTIIIDEPELGLHPKAIMLLGDMIHKASEKSQIILSTQSIDLINNFDPEDIIMADFDNSSSSMRRLTTDELKGWLDEYTLGEIWEMNKFGGA